MTDVVLDASAVLAMLREEPGSDAVAAHIGRAAISVVNLQEAAKEMLREGVSPETAQAVLGLNGHPHNREAAYAAAALYEQTKQYGCDLGDRSSMALGLQLGVPVLTTDREWQNAVVEGLRLEYVR